jgi:hypothetical protein
MIGHFCAKPGAGEVSNDIQRSVPSVYAPRGEKGQYDRYSPQQ